MVEFQRSNLEMTTPDSTVKITSSSGLFTTSGPESHTKWPTPSYVASHMTVDSTTPVSTDPHGHHPDSLFLGWVNMTDVRTAFDCGVIPVLSVLGIAGNCLCVVVFVKQRYRSVAKPLLLALCASDILFLLATFLVSLPCLVRKVNEKDGKMLHVHMVPQVDVFRDIMSRVTVMLTLAIGVERCVAVTRPLKLRGLCSIPRTRTAVLIIFLCVFALKSPAFFRYDVKRHVTPDNFTTVDVYKTSFYLDNKNMLDFYFDYFLLVTLQGLPLVSIVLCLVIVLVNLKRRLQCAYPRTVAKFGAFARARGKDQDKYKETEHADLVLEERKLTRALLVILLLCIISELPYLITEMYHVIRPDVQSPSFLVARDVSRVLCVLNSAINFVVFMRLYKHFSVTFKTFAGLCN